MTRHDPATAEWLKGQLDGSILKSHGSETGPLMEPVQALVMMPEPAIAPAHVLLSWHRMIAQTKTELRQSEAGFVTAARRAGWGDASIAEALNIQSESVDERLADLRDADANEHPSRNAVPWTGFQADGNTSSSTT